MKIIIVDDNKENLYLLEKVLNASGYEVVSAVDGAEALEKLRANSFDMIISDILMPVMDGFRLCHECKSDEKLKHIPFVFYTATYIDEKDEELALKLAADKFIRKPVDLDEFMNIIRGVFRRAEEGRLVAKKPVVTEEADDFRLYSQRLVKKLEKKMLDLEREITEHKLADELLVISEKRYRTLLESAAEGILIADVETKQFNYANPAICKMLGYSEDELTGMGVMDIHPPDSVEYVISEFEAQARGGKTLTLDIPCLKKDGTIIYADINTTSALIDERECNIGFFSDITERKQADELLRNSEQELRLMFESVSDGITITDLNGNIVDVNDTVVRIHSYDSKEQLIGRSSLELIAQRDHAGATKNLIKTSEEGSSGVLEYTLLRKDGSEFPGELSAALMRNQSGEPTGFVAITRDITERKQMQAQLLTNDRLAAIGELISGVAHELNNPLTGVIGFSDLLADRKDLPKDIMDDIKIINSEAQRTANIVKNLLTFARKQPKEKQLTDINRAIEAVITLLAYEQKVNNIEVNTRFASDLPEIMANTFDLQQVFLNIVVNAEHAMVEAHGKGTITITTVRDGDIIRVSLADDGPGISEENLGHVFDPFFTTKEVGKGTGLGLSICYGTITDHGGRIYAESKPGQGATFIIELPVVTTDTEGTKNENS